MHIGCIKNGAGAPQPIPQSGGPRLPSLPPAHPAFTAGAGYLLRGHLAPRLYLASLDLRLFPVEDVFTTAHCARRVGGGAHPPAHDARFSCGQMAAPAEADECGGAEGAFTVHKVEPSRMARMKRALEEGRCSKAKRRARR